MCDPSCCPMCFPFLSSPLLSSPSSPSSRLPPFPPSLPPLSAAHLSDLETSVDSRCTTDSADSAFIGRRYWFLPSPFYHFCSQIILLRPPTPEVSLQVKLLGQPLPPKIHFCSGMMLQCEYFQSIDFFFFNPLTPHLHPLTCLVRTGYLYSWLFYHLTVCFTACLHWCFIHI